MLTRFGPTLGLALTLADYIPLFSIARPNAGRIIPISKMRQFNPAQRNADQMFPLLADQFPLGQKLAQIVPNPPFDDLPESLVIFFDLQDHCSLFKNIAPNALS